MKLEPHNPTGAPARGRFILPTVAGRDKLVRELAAKWGTDANGVGLRSRDTLVVARMSGEWMALPLSFIRCFILRHHHVVAPYRNRLNGLTQCHSARTPSGTATAPSCPRSCWSKALWCSLHSSRRSLSWRSRNRLQAMRSSEGILRAVRNLCSSSLTEAVRDHVKTVDFKQDPKVGTVGLGRPICPPAWAVRMNW